MANQSLNEPVLFLVVLLNQQSSHRQFLFPTTDCLPHTRHNLCSLRCLILVDSASLTLRLHSEHDECLAVLSSNEIGIPQLTHNPFALRLACRLCWYSNRFLLVFGILYFTKYILAVLRKGSKPYRPSPSVSPLKCGA